MRTTCRSPIPCRAAALFILLAVNGLAVNGACAFPGLTAEETRKLDPLLATAAAPFASDAGAPGAATGAATTLGPMAIAAGVELKGGVATVPLLIQVAGGDTRGLAALGVAVDAVVGEVATARGVPLARIADLARRPEVAVIQAARRLVPLNDVSVPETRAPGVWTDPFNATGQGVIVGVIDTGIDVNHPDFQLANGDTRIKLLLDLSQSGGGPFGGTLFTESQINSGIVAPDRVGHGTHVAGTAAGGGRADGLFRGVAFEADLIVVNADRTGVGSFTENDIVNALGFIDEEAADFNQAYVVNLSLGGHNGAHDGSGLQELAMDFLVGAGKPGKAIVAAAGNERSGPRRHATGEVVQNDLPDGITIDFNVPNYTPRPGLQNDLVVINLWYEAFSTFAVTLETPSGFSVGPFVTGETNEDTGAPTDDGLVGIFNAPGGTSPQNGDYEATIVILDLPLVPAPGTWTIHVAGDTGPFDAYIAFSSMGAALLGPYATTQGFISEPGTARNVITVGSYTSKIEWDDTDGNHHDLRFLGQPDAVVGSDSPFSNAGPTRDGRVKPEVCAPGELIASCFSADAPPGSPGSVYTSPFPQWPNFFILPGDRYAIQQGTSQATPHVVGAVALLFQLHPEWDILDVKRALAVTARNDLFTLAAPEVFGNGKLDVLAAATATAPGDSLPPGDIDADGDVDLDDATLAIDFVLGRSTPNPGEEERADLNADRVLNVGDIVLLIQELVGAVAGTPALPLETDGNTWILPVTLTAERPVVGAEIEVEAVSPGVLPLVRAVRTGRDHVLALGEEKGTVVRIVALALDEGGLAGREPVIHLPFRTEPGLLADGPEAGWRIRRLRLAGPGAEPVQGQAHLGAAVRVLAPSLRVLPVAANPSPEPGPIAFDLPGPGAQPVRVGIYDVTGRLIVQLADGIRDPGRHVIAWNGSASTGRRVPAGVYWVRVEAGEENTAARLTLVR